MTYRGIVKQGTVVIEGDAPIDGTIVDITPIEEIPPAKLEDPTSHPAFGIWKDRTDLPQDSVETSKVLRERLMHRSDE